MKQIKTIYHKNSDDFDVEVNNELRDGWSLTWRAVQVQNGAIYFFAGLERDILPDGERDCDNCRHLEKLGDEPCIFCKDFNRWVS